MPYLGRRPAGTAGNVITGDLKVTGSISADSIHESMILNGTDGSKSNANKFFQIKNNNRVYTAD